MIENCRHSCDSEPSNHFQDRHMYIMANNGTVCNQKGSSGFLCNTYVLIVTSLINCIYIYIYIYYISYLSRQAKW